MIVILAPDRREYHRAAKNLVNKGVNRREIMYVSGDPVPIWGLYKPKVYVLDGWRYSSEIISLLFQMKAELNWVPTDKDADENA